MARLKLNPNYALKDLGKEVLIAAQGKYSGNPTVFGSAEANIRKMLADDGNLLLENPTVEFVYDSEDKVHIVVPYVGDKVVRDQDFFPEFDLDHLAAETMGFIVIFGCAK
ncbi:hypothetical protein [Antarctobacter sp.]|uniref:hypothetical protein n=1 Tax=Antarctobacter sp. TaxID=1872577 RepID=UPI003A8D5B29